MAYVVSQTQKLVSAKFLGNKVIKDFIKFCICSYVCLYFKFSLGCRVATFWEIAAHSVDHMFPL